jgi:S-adenosylhomocysteine hydrolase
MNAPKTEFTDYRVADLTLAEWGRKEIAIAESEMPGADGDPRGIRSQTAAPPAQGSPVRCT